MKMLERDALRDEITTEKAWPGAVGLLITSALAVLVAGLLLVDAAFAGGRPGGPGSRGHARGKVSDDLFDAAQTGAPRTALSVIIQTQHDPGDSDLQRFRGHGADVRKRHVAITGVTASVPVADLDDLADDPEVAHISLDLPVRAQLDVAVRAANGGLLLDQSSGLDGRGVGIVLIDTGIQLHPDLDRWRQDGPMEVDIIGRDRGFVDTFGHGTHVAGILNGNGLLSSGRDAFRTFRGVAPGAKLIALRALRPDGTGQTSDVLSAIDWAISHRRQYNIRVLNMSLGHPVTESFTTDPLCRAVRAAVRSGITVVVAAGNNGRVGTGFGTILSPGNEPSAVTVGAIDDRNTVAREDDALAPFSARGPSLIDHIVKPDLVAPGAFIVSLRAPGSLLDTAHHDLVLPAGAYRTDGNHQRDGDYLELSGTSLAAPMVAGTAAVMLQKDPRLTPAQVKARLMASAVKDDRLPFETGAGALDIAGALQSNATADSALSPQAVVADDGSIVLVPLEGSWDDSWQQGLIWGGSRLFGFAMATENTLVSVDGLVWGGSGTRLLDFGILSTEGMLWGGGGN
jgi:serine protease AprX